MFRILIADDPELMLALDASFVKRNECEVLTAVSADEALEKLETELPELVLLGVSIGNDDGLEVCRRIKARAETCRVPVVMVGSREDFPDIDDAGADARVERPVSPDNLLATLRPLLPFTQRTVPRRPASLRVDYYGNEFEGVGYTKDIGPSGLFLKSREALPVGTEMQLIFDLPLESGPTIRADARVVRVVTQDRDSYLIPGVAVEFQQIGNRDRAELARFVND